MSLSTLAAGGAIASLVALSMTFGAAAPASAVEPPSGPLFPSTANAFDYALTVRGMDIYDSQPASAKAAWSPQMAKVAAANANIYRAASVYGVIEPDKIANVIPMNKVVDQGLNGKLPVNTTVTNGATTWKGTGFKFPKFPAAPFAAVRGAVGGPVGATVALVGFMERAEIANGILSWVGQDAAGTVCSDPVAGGNNPINWLTGQDCEQWAAEQAFVPNVGTIVRPNGWQTYPICTNPGTATDLGQGACAGVFLVSPEVKSLESQSLSWVDLYGVQRPHGFQAKYWCRNSTTGTVGAVKLGPSWTFSNTNPQAHTAGCGAGEKLYAYFIGGGSSSTAPDAWFASQTTVQKTYWWFSGDSPNYLAGVETDPSRYMECKQYGASGATSVGITANFKESDLVNGGEAPSPVCTPLPNGEQANRVVVTERGGGQNLVHYDQQQTAAATDWGTKYAAGCGAAVTQRTCLLDVVQISNGISCFSATANCADWMTDPNRDTKYQCQYGGRNETVQQCYVYANVFNPAKREAGNPYADPLTGEDVGGGTGVSEDVKTMGNPAGSVINPDGSVQSCWGGKSPGGFNPISWIVRGGQCLMNWAFVPRDLKLKYELDQTGTLWAATTPAKFFAAIDAWAISPSVAGCSSSLPFPIPLIGKTIMVPVIQACPGTPMGDFAPWVRGLVSAGLVITAGFACKRIIQSWAH